jgi:hypothetical protein
VKLQSVAQREFPDLAIILDKVTLNHLRLRLVALVKAVKSVEYQATMHDRGTGRRLDRVQQRQILRWNKFQRRCWGASTQARHC